MKRRDFLKATAMGVTFAGWRGVFAESAELAQPIEAFRKVIKSKDRKVFGDAALRFRRWMKEYSLIKKPGQHELGGADIWVLTPELYYAAKDRLVMGERPVPDELMETAQAIRIPSQEQLIKQMTGKA